MKMYTFKVLDNGNIQSTKEVVGPFFHVQLPLRGTVWDGDSNPGVGSVGSGDKELLPNTALSPPQWFRISGQCHHHSCCFQPKFMLQCMLGDDTDPVPHSKAQNSCFCLDRQWGWQTAVVTGQNSQPCMTGEDTGSLCHNSKAQNNSFHPDYQWGVTICYQQSRFMILRDWRWHTPSTLQQDTKLLLLPWLAMGCDCCRQWHHSSETQNRCSLLYDTSTFNQ